MRNFVRGSDNLNPNDVSAIVFCFASSKILLLMCLQSLSKLSHKSLGGYAFTMSIVRTVKGVRTPVFDLGKVKIGRAHV